MKKESIILLGILLILFLNYPVAAEKIGIQRTSDPFKIKFVINVFDDNNNKIDSDAEYQLFDPFSNEVSSGVAKSGEEVVYLPQERALDSGTWELIAKYKDESMNEVFNIAEIDKLDIRIEEGYLILKNIGNTMYNKEIVIKIGGEGNPERVFLDIGQTNKIKLTAPDGVYDVSVSDGTKENEVSFSGIGLTGNVIGTEKEVKSGFFDKNMIITIFLLGLVFLLIIVSVVNIRKRYSK